VADFLSYGEKDNSKVVYLLILVLSIFSLWFLLETDILDYLVKGGVSNSSELLPQVIIALFRTACAYITFHAIFVWMILDKNGAIMYAFFKKEKQVLYRHIWRFERLVTFSSWNLTILCLTFTLMSLTTWGEIFQIVIPESLKIITSILFSTSLGMITFTSTIVTYILVPEAIKSGREYDYLFEKHQQMMHNWPVLLLFLDLVLTKPILVWQFAIFGIIISIIYAIFAYIFAIYGGGYYVYQFIDPRLKYSPIIMSLLGGAIASFYLFTWVGLKILEWNYFIGILIFTIWGYSIVLFKPNTVVKMIPNS
tara:strand:+ start:277 stop:1203 length:927 start_codon:yes stop_codon:yes gene_type:complete